jgi:hypothetical protein
MNKFFNYVASASGYKDSNHLLDSTFHPSNAEWMISVSAFFAGVAYIFEHVFGIHLLVGVILSILFFLELYTGIKASKKEGIPFESNLFQKGWVKLGIYMIMIGSSYTLSVFVPHNVYAGIDINIYAFLHYAFYNYVLVSLFISNIENFIRLGWKFGGLIMWIGKRLNLKVYQEHKDDIDAGK